MSCFFFPPLCPDAILVHKLLFCQTHCVVWNKRVTPPRWVQCILRAPSPGTFLNTLCNEYHYYKHIFIHFHLPVFVSLTHPWQEETQWTDTGIVKRQSHKWENIKWATGGYFAFIHGCGSQTQLTVITQGKIPRTCNVSFRWTPSSYLV